MGRLDERLTGLGRIITHICTLAQVACGVSVGYALLVCVLAQAGTPWAASAAKHLMDSGLIATLGHARLLPQGPAPAHTTLLCTAVYVLGQLFLLHLGTQVKGLVRELAGSSHFSHRAADMLRQALWEVVLVALWNMAASVVLLVFTLFVSYLIDYGATLEERASETSRIQEEMIESFAEICENKSAQTGGHVRRVSEYTRILAHALGYAPKACERIRLASMMHDVGKLLVASEILEKPGRLTDEEFRLMQEHVTYGARLLEDVEGDVMRLAHDIARDHHERWDGRGYGRGLAGTDISREARIVAVADVYDALTSRRSYKEAWDERAARDEIARQSGSQFDPEVVRAFLDHYDEISAVRAKAGDAGSTRDHHAHPSLAASPYHPCAVG